MKRRLFLMGVAGMAGCTSRKRPRLNVYNWSSYVAPETVPNFEREFNVSVRYSTYEVAEEMLAKVAAGNSGWDVVFPSNSYVAAMREYGLLTPLDHARLPNLEHLEARFRDSPWDPGLRSSVPYMVGSTGILYNKSLSPAPAGWSDYWQDRFQRRVTMLDDANEVLGACLKKAGRALNSSDSGELTQAKNEALSMKPLLRAYLNAEVQEQVMAGDVLMAQLWVNNAKLACLQNPQLGFVHPVEGFPLFSDTAVILRESRRVELAHEFINYLHRPAVASRIAQAVTAATPNETARKLLPVALRDDVALYPPAEVLSRGEWFSSLPPAGQRLRDRLWTEIKAA